MTGSSQLSAREDAKMKNHVDENQSRVLASKEDLNSFYNVINKQTLVNKLMEIYPTVSIASKDFMAQFMCNTCLKNVNIALQWMAQCEDHNQPKVTKMLY